MKRLADVASSSLGIRQECLEEALENTCRETRAMRNARGLGLQCLGRRGRLAPAGRQMGEVCTTCDTSNNAPI